jgi:hypothetical protein
MRLRRSTSTLASPVPLTESIRHSSPQVFSSAPFLWSHACGRIARLRPSSPSKADPAMESAGASLVIPRRLHRTKRVPSWRNRSSANGARRNARPKTPAPSLTSASQVVFSGSFPYLLSWAARSGGQTPSRKANFWTTPRLKLVPTPGDKGPTYPPWGMKVSRRKNTRTCSCGMQQFAPEFPLRCPFSSKTAAPFRGAAVLATTRPNGARQGSGPDQTGPNSSPCSKLRRSR